MHNNKNGKVLGYKTTSIKPNCNTRIKSQSHTHEFGYKLKVPKAITLHE